MRTPKKLFQAKRFAVEEVEETLPNGGHLVRHIVRHPGAVVVLPIVSPDQICMIQTYRVAIDRWHLELPAGTLDKSLTPAQTAETELQEETGYTAHEWARAGVLHTAIAYSTEFIDIWFARGLTLGEQNLDAGEFLDVFSAMPEDLMNWCGNGQVTDAKTLTGMLWLKNVLSGAWTLEWQAAGL